MSPRVTVVLIARNGAQHLPRTLAALSAQTRQPDAVVMVDCASTDRTAELLAAYGPTHLISAAEELSFGDAIATAVRVTAQPTGPDEMLWLLAQDTAPEPRALAALLNALEVAPSVAIAGPKQMDWERGDYIHELGETITQLGASVTLVSSELDQAQHDGLSDVMGVAAGGMLVRHHVWEQLNGFDPGLPVVDNALDFCIRARLAGHRVSVVPAAKVAVAGDGIAGPSNSQKGSARRKRVRLRRQAQLHRRLVYAPPLALPLHWLSLVPLAFMRAFLRLMRKDPGAIGAEFGAAFGAAFAGIRVSNARHKLKATRTLGWNSLSSLRMPGAEVRRRRALLREQQRSRARGAHNELAFVSSGGAWTLIAAIVAGIALVAPLLGASAVVGGGLLPVNSPAMLWQNISYGWRDIGTGFIGAADPFTAVLAVLGSMTFWSPSALMLALYFAALPLAALGAWFAACRLTDRGSLRALAAVLWMLAPTFVSAIADGRPAAIIAHILLPWLFFAASAAARSWSASAAAALLFAAIVACVPSLTPALLVLWLLAMVFSGRSIMRFIGIPIPALALAAPLIFDQQQRGNLWGLLADPGVPLASQPSSVWQLLYGFPSGDFGGWNATIDALGINWVTASMLVPILLAPLVIVAFLALFLPGSRTALWGILTALLGFATAFAASQISVATVGDHSVQLWAGAGISLYWAGLIGAAIIGLRALGSGAIVPTFVTGITAAIVILPLAASVTLGSAAPQAAAIHAGEQRLLPAFVTAEAQTDPGAGTLVLVPQPSGAVLAQLQRGAGTRLDDQSTLYATDQTLNERDVQLAELAGNLSSRSGFDATESFADLGIKFVLLEPASVESDEVGQSNATEVLRRTETSLDANPLLVSVGQTDFGTLWRYQDAAEVTPVIGANAIEAGSFEAMVSRTALWVQIAVFGFVLLLSIPTGAGREPALARAGKARPDDEQPENVRPEKVRPEKVRPEKVRPEKVRREKVRKLSKAELAGAAAAAAGTAATAGADLEDEKPAEVIDTESISASTQDVVEQAPAVEQKPTVEQAPALDHTPVAERPRAAEHTPGEEQYIATDYAPAAENASALEQHAPVATTVVEEPSTESVPPASVQRHEADDIDESTILIRPGNSARPRGNDNNVERDSAVESEQNDER